MKITSILVIGMLLLSVSYFNARENSKVDLLDNVKLVPGKNVIIADDGNLKIDFGTLMSGAEVIYTDAFGVENQNELPVKIISFRVTGNEKGCSISVLPSENILVDPTETVWFSVSLKVGLDAGIRVSVEIVPVISFTIS